MIEVTRLEPMAFTGFPEEGLDFYDDLELENARPFWEANKNVYERSVRAPMVALLDELAPEFAPEGVKPKIFRPHRDVRFSKDKTPYKIHQGAFIATGPATGWYVELSARGVSVGGGFYEAAPARLAAVRQAIDVDLTGERLERIVRTLRRGGWTFGGDAVRTTPRGWSADHPRIDLLRLKQFIASKHYGFEADALGPELPSRIRRDWRKLRPLHQWLVAVPDQPLERSAR